MNYTAEDIELNAKEDIELYEEFINGDKEAFNEIIRKYRRTLILFIMRLVKNKEVAEDIAQDAFVYILMNKEEYNMKYSFKTYLYTIAKCRAMNHIKKERKIIPFDEAYIKEVEEEIVEESILENENKRELYEALRKLKKSQQIVVYLKEIEGLRYKEISKILNKTETEVKMIGYRGRKRLEKLIRKEEEK